MFPDKRWRYLMTRCLLQQGQCDRALAMINEIPMSDEERLLTLCLLAEIYPSSPAQPVLDKELTAKARGYVAVRFVKERDEDPAPTESGEAQGVEQFVQNGAEPAGSWNSIYR
jgi:hypothetical protein